MPIYRVQAPDGSVFRVQAPEGATEDQVLAYAQQHYQNEGATGGGRFGGIPVDADAGQPRTQRLSEVTGPQYSEDELFTKLERADAAGDTEAAQVLADEIQRTRSEVGMPGQRMKLSQVRALHGEDLQPGQPIQIPLPDGNVAEFPAGTAQEVMQRAVQEYQPEQPANGPWTRYQQGNRLQQIESALRAADAAGNTEDARRLAQAYAQERDKSVTAQPEGPWTRYQSAEQKADFRNVRSAIRSTGDLVRPGQRMPLANGPASTVAYQPGMGRVRNAIGTHDQAAETASRAKLYASLPVPARLAIGAGSRVAAAGRGGQQLYARAADAILPREQGRAGFMAGPSRYDEAMAAETRARERDAPIRDDAAGNIGMIAGDVGMMAAPGGALTRLLGTSGRAALAANVGLGAGYSGLQPVVQGESRARNAAIGGGFGAGAHGLSALVGAAGRRASAAVPSDVQTMARRAHELGIPLHAAQVSQSLPVKVAASAGKYLPFSGHSKAATRQQEAVNRAVGRTFGADAPKLTDDVMRQARQTLSRQFEDIYSRNTVSLTSQRLAKLREVERTASRRLTKDEGQVLRNQLEDILDNADNGVLTGQKYQAVRSMLKKAEGNDKLGQAVRELRTTLDDIAAESVGAADALTLKRTRSGWANMRTAEDALKQKAGASGDIRPDSLWPLIRKGSTKEMREIARMGQTLLRDPIADSGSAQRTLMYNLLMGGGSIANPALIPLIAKAAAGGATVGRLANSNTLARFLARPYRGKPTSQLGELMKSSAPYAAPAAGAEYNRRP